MKNLPIIFKLIAISFLVLIKANADNFQSQLFDMAVKEASIANIGANKASMLYGKNNPITIIDQWNKVAHRAKLNQVQINQINLLEQDKQVILADKRCG